MNILRQFKENAIGRKIDGFRSVVMGYDVKEITPVSFDPLVTIYQLKATFGTTFSCPSEYFDKAMKSAEAEILHGLYGDIETKLRTLQEAIYGGEREQALHVVDDIFKSIRP